MRFALWNIFFCLDFDPFFFSSLVPMVGVLFIYLFIYIFSSLASSFPFILLFQQFPPTKE
jgi:hypothetical protein